MPKCSAGSFHYRVVDALPDELGEAFGPVMETIASLTAKIKEHNRKIEGLAEERYPETELLRQVPGVGVLTALTFVLTLEAPNRFAKSRSVGPYLGLVPSNAQSGQHNPRGASPARETSSSGASWSAAPTTFSVRSPRTRIFLRRHGEKIAGRGGKGGKKRAVVAVARKLSVVLHRLWATGEVYDPVRNSDDRNSDARGAEEVA